MLSNVSFAFLLYLAVVGTIALFWSEARVWQDHLVRREKTREQYIQALVDAMPSIQYPQPTLTQPLEKTCSEGILAVTWVTNILAAPIYAYWAYSSRIGSPVLALFCLGVFAVWLVELSWSLFQFAPIIKRAISKRDERGGDVAMRQSLKKDISSSKEPALPYSWRGVVRRVRNEIPHLYLVYLLIVLIFVR